MMQQCGDAVISTVVSKQEGPSSNSPTTWTTGDLCTPPLVQCQLGQDVVIDNG